MFRLIMFCAKQTWPQVQTRAATDGHVKYPFRAEVTEQESRSRSDSEGRDRAVDRRRRKMQLITVCVSPELLLGLSSSSEKWQTSFKTIQAFFLTLYCDPKSPQTSGSEEKDEGACFFLRPVALSSFSDCRLVGSGSERQQTEETDGRKTPTLREKTPFESSN